MGSQEEAGALEVSGSSTASTGLLFLALYFFLVEIKKLIVYLHTETYLSDSSSVECSGLITVKSLRPACLYPFCNNEEHEDGFCQKHDQRKINYTKRCRIGGCFWHAVGDSDYCMRHQMDDEDMEYVSSSQAEDSPKKAEQEHKSEEMPSKKRKLSL
jgi:hypothetical protein